MKAQMTIAVLLAVGLFLALGAQAVAAGTITSSSLTTETDIVNTGQALIAAQAFGGQGAATVNGITHVNSNSGYTPINFSGPYGDPIGFSGDLFKLIDGIAGTTDANEPASLTVGGLTPGEDYLFQTYWIVKENFATRKMNVNLEGDTATISANPNQNEAVLISYDFTAADGTFNGTFDGSDGVGTGTNGWLCGYSLQAKDPPPPPPPTVTVTDDFNTGHDYLTAGTGGTVWDGIVNPNNAVALDADTTSTDELRIQATGSKGWNAGTNNAPFLYMDVAGDFDARVEVPAMSSGNYNVGALMARLGDPLANGGAGEDYVMVTSNRFSSNAIQTRILQDGVQNDSYGSSNLPFPRYLRLTRTGNTFNAFESTDGTTWTAVNWGGTLGPGLGLDLVRADLDGLPLQVGLWQGSFTSSGHTADFDNFSIVVPASGDGDIPEPATLGLLSLAACGLGGYVRRRRKA